LRLGVDSSILFSEILRHLPIVSSSIIFLQNARFWGFALFALECFALTLVIIEAYTARINYCPCRAAKASFTSQTVNHSSIAALAHFASLETLRYIPSLQEFVLLHNTTRIGHRAVCFVTGASFRIRQYTTGVVYQNDNSLLATVVNSELRHDSITPHTRSHTDICVNLLLTRHSFAARLMLGLVSALALVETHSSDTIAGAIFYCGNLITPITRITIPKREQFSTVRQSFNNSAQFWLCVLAMMTNIWFDTAAMLSSF